MKYFQKTSLKLFLTVTALRDHSTGEKRFTSQLTAIFPQVLFRSEIFVLHKWLSGSAHKSGGRQMQGAIPGALVELAFWSFP